MQIKQIEVYEYQELTQKAQKVAYENWRSGVEHDFLGESMQYKLDMLLRKYKIQSDNAQTYFSLSYSQGDGVMFYGNFTWKKYNVDIKHSGRYYHSNSKDIEISTQKLSFEVDEKIHNQFEKIYQKICKELETYGYKAIEDEESLESFKACCEDYNYTFDENGKMENI